MPLNTYSQKESKPVKLRYDPDSSLKDEQEESIISITESNKEIIAEFEESPDKIFKTTQRSARKQNEEQVNLQRMMQANTDEKLDEYHPLLYGGDKYSSITPDPVEKFIENYQKNSNANTESFKTLNFTNKVSHQVFPPDELEEEEEPPSERISMEKKKSETSKYLTKNCEMESNFQEPEEAYSVHYDTKNITTINDYKVYQLGEDLETYSLNTGSVTHRGQDKNKRFIFEDPDQKEASEEEISKKPGNFTQRIPNSQKIKQSLGYLRTPEILNKQVAKSKSPRNIPGQTNYKEMVKTNITSFRESIIMKKMMNRATQSRKRVSSK